MREILFRAKRLDNGEWVEGFIVARQANTYPDGFEIIETDGINYDELDFWQPAFQSYGVYPKTICQYTGLTDKNGNKIWENDVVRKSDTNALGWGRVRNCKISFDKLGYWLLTTQYGDGYWLGEFNAEQLEVIGNIFDNPELMENK